MKGERTKEIVILAWCGMSVDSRIYLAKMWLLKKFAGGTIYKKMSKFCNYKSNSRG